MESEEESPSGPSSLWGDLTLSSLALNSPPPKPKKSTSSAGQADVGEGYAFKMRIECPLPIEYVQSVQHSVKKKLSVVSLAVCMAMQYVFY